MVGEGIKVGVASRSLLDPWGSQHKKPIPSNLSSRKLGVSAQHPLPAPPPISRSAPGLSDAPDAPHTQQLSSPREGARCGEAPSAAGAPDQLLLRARRLRMCELQEPQGGQGAASGRRDH